jgi:hypothetical protein
MTRWLQPCRQYCHRLGMKPALKRSMPSPTRPAISDRFWTGAQHIGDHESCASNPSDGSQVGGRRARPQIGDTSQIGELKSGGHRQRGATMAPWAPG